LRSDEVDRLASPYTGLQLIAHRVLHGLVATVPVGWRKLPVASLSAGGFVLFWYLFIKYHRVNGFLPDGAYP
jgi:hypothetical protein